jgi:hypothetical protein
VTVVPLAEWKVDSTVLRMAVVMDERKAADWDDQMVVL